MKTLAFLAAALVLAGCATPQAGRAPASPAAGTAAAATDAPPTAWQTRTFGPLAALAGQRFRSAPAEGQPSDIQDWSWDLGGAVLVSRHALADGSYGGVTHIYRNTRTGKLDYVYVTNGGFVTEGSFTLTGNTWHAVEAVSGHETITAVRSTGTIHEDGRLTMVSEYLKSGEWVPGRNAAYLPAPDAKMPDLNAPE